MSSWVEERLNAKRVWELWDNVEVLGSLSVLGPEITKHQTHLHSLWMHISDDEGITHGLKSLTTSYSTDVIQTMPMKRKLQDYKMRPIVQRRHVCGSLCLHPINGRAIKSHYWDAHLPFVIWMFLKSLGTHHIIKLNHLQQYTNHVITPTLPFIVAWWAFFPTTTWGSRHQRAAMMHLTGQRCWDLAQA